jgi:glycerol kinase
MPPTLIGLDAGTTGVTAVLFDQALRPLAQADRDFPQHFPEPGLVEHDDGELLGAVHDVLRELLGRPEAAEVAALGVTNQRETVFAVEPGGGRAYRRGIVWQDRRTARRCEELRAAGRAELVRERTGLVLDPYFSATKIEWLLQNVADLAERARGGGVVFCTVDALVLQHLTEQQIWATDPTNASRTLLFDIEARRWDVELCALFGVRPGWLPEVRPSCGSFGATSKYLLGRAIPILGVAGDQQAALLGQGCVEAGSLKVTYGTGAFLLLNTGARRARSSAGLVATLAIGADGGPCFALEGSVFVAGALVQFLRDQLGLIASADEIEALASSVPDCAGVTIVPALAGLGAPYWAPDARGAILGLTRGTTRAHIARAALEAIAFQVAELVELVRRDSGLAVERLLADGGAAQNELLLALQADLAGVEVSRGASLEATARGAALLAGKALGWWDARGPAALPPDVVARPSLAPGARAERLAAWKRALARVL